MIHIPVFVEEVLSVLHPLPNSHFIDATVGEGSHAQAVLQKTSPKGLLLGIDKDQEQIRRAKDTLSEFGNRVTLVRGSFRDIVPLSAPLAKIRGIEWSGVLFDLGWSQVQIAISNRGFSFLKEEMLDMRYDVSSTLTAKEIVNNWRREELEHILESYGQEPFAHSISEKIVLTRKSHPINTTKDLVAIIISATPNWYKKRRLHPATQTFQALRIAVNNELKEAMEGIKGAMEIVKKGGTVAVISFHSGEDRLVKRLFRELEKEGKGIIRTKKPILPSRQEIKNNPRARSAKLRAFQLL